MMPTFVGLYRFSEWPKWVPSERLQTTAETIAEATQKLSASVARLEDRGFPKGATLTSVYQAGL